MTSKQPEAWAGMNLAVRDGNKFKREWFYGLEDLPEKYDLLVVGAGISGCVFAEQASRRFGWKTLIIDKRDHIGGNCYDFINKFGIRVSQYGVHLFHTKFTRVWKYVNQFSKWIPYEHRVKGKVDVGLGYKIVPIPPSQETINSLFNAKVKNEKDMEVWLEERRVVNDRPKNGEESALNRSGKELYDAIFKYYTKKQWDKWPAELDASVLARIPVRTNTDNRYFTDPYQALPKNGYTCIFENMILNDDNITVRLDIDFFEMRHRLPSSRYVIFTGPIDSYYSSLGLPKLEYRSLHFQEEIHETEEGYFQPCLQLNYPGNEVEYTRIVEYKHKPNQPKSAKASKFTVIFKEFSCDDGEPYYPVPNPTNRSLYEKYREMASKEKGVCFVGRLASYKYFNMDQAFLNALEVFDEYFNCGEVKTGMGEGNEPK